MIGTTTSTSYTDNSVPRTLYTYAGGSSPNACKYSYAWYWVVAYNSGAKGTSNDIYYTSDDDGADPNQISCQ